MPKDRQTKKYQSIEPQRTSLYNEKNKYQLRKIAEGLNDINLVRVNPAVLNREQPKGKVDLTSPIMINSPH